MQAEELGSQPPSQWPQAEAADTVERDPGLIIVYTHDQDIHDALGQPGAPVAQGATSSDSSEAFQEFIFRIILTTPVVLEENYLVKSTVGGVPLMFPSLFHRLTHNQIFRIMAHLMHTFITNRTPTAQWSLGLEHPLGTLVRVTGAGTGAVCYTLQSVDDGIFRTV